MLDVKKLEAMAMLNLENEDRIALEKRVSELADEFSMLENVDTDGVEPLASVLEINNILREDRVEKLVSRDELLENAPEQYDGYFQVPETLE